MAGSPCTGMSRRRDKFIPLEKQSRFEDELKKYCIPAKAFHAATQRTLRASVSQTPCSFSGPCEPEQELVRASVSKTHPSLPARQRLTRRPSWGSEFAQVRRWLPLLHPRCRAIAAAKAFASCAFEFVPVC